MLASDHRSARMDVRGDQEEEMGGGGFLERVKGFIYDISEALEEAATYSKPDAIISAVYTTSIDLHRADLLVDVLVTNPCPHPALLSHLRYLVESNSRQLSSGFISDAGTIAPHGSEIIKVPLHLVFDDIRSVHDSLRPGSIIPCRVAMELTASLPVLGNITVPMEKEGEMPVPQGPEVDLENFRLDRDALGEATAMLQLRIVNRNKFDLGLNWVECEVWLGGVGIGGSSLRRWAVIGKHGSEMVEVPVTVRARESGSAWPVWGVGRLRRGDYAMKGCLDVDTPFGSMKLPFSSEGRLGFRDGNR